MQQSAQGVGQGGQGGQGRGRAGQATRCWDEKRTFVQAPPTTQLCSLEAPGRPEEVPFCDHPQGEGHRVITSLRDQYWFRGPFPWLWRGGQAYWVALRHRGRGAEAPPTHSRWAAYALSLGFWGLGFRVGVHVELSSQKYRIRYVLWRTD